MLQPKEGGRSKKKTKVLLLLPSSSVHFLFRAAFLFWDNTSVLTGAICNAVPLSQQRPPEKKENTTLLLPKQHHNAAQQPPFWLFFPPNAKHEAARHTKTPSPPTSEQLNHTHTHTHTRSRFTRCCHCPNVPYRALSSPSLFFFPFLLHFF